MRQRMLWGLAMAGLLGAGPLRAQQLWEPELGIRGGWSQTKVNGAANAINFIDFPGQVSLSTVTGSAPGNVGRAPLFAVIPVAARIALVPEMGWNEVGFSGSPITIWQAGAVANYALTPRIYAGAGASLFFFRAGGTEQAQGGLLVNAGYRIPISRTLRLRIEGYYNGRPTANFLHESYAFGVSLGVSTVLK